MFKKVVLIGLVLIGVGAFYYRDALLSMFGKSQRTINQTEVKLLLEDDFSIDSLAMILVEKEILSSIDDFRKEAEKQGLNDQSFDAGKYIILSGTKVANLVDGFTRAENGQGKSEVKVNVLFNRCTRIEDIGMNISQYIKADSASIVDCIQSEETMKKYGFTDAQLPALFLPDSYEMYYDSDAEAFVAFMAVQFKEFWNAERMAQLKALGFQSPSQAVTLASIVYSEQSKVPEEWPIIAKLYLNRINQGILLQSDPTFKFCWGTKLDGVQRLLAKHRNIDCPYNTYKYLGLPPGPICITPGKVIDAVLKPADVDYIFMCAKPGYDGSHNFTNSGAQHIKNASEFQRWLSKEQKK